jgi:hypothetical protein
VVMAYFCWDLLLTPLYHVPLAYARPYINRLVKSSVVTIP